MQHREKRMSCWTPPRVRARKTPPTTSQRNHSPKRERATTWKRPLGLVENVTENEQTEPTLHEKVSSLVNSLLTSVLNEPALLKRKENIKRPENCKLLRVTKAGIPLKKQPEAWMPGHKKCSNHLSIASFPLPGLWKEGATPSPAELWKGLSNSVLLRSLCQTWAKHVQARSI